MRRWAAHPFPIPYTMTLSFRIAPVVMALAFVSAAPRAAAPPVQQDWPTHERDLAGQRHSPLTQITPANVGTLQVAWTFDAQASAFQTTPIVVGGVMYLTAGRNVFALEPETGKVVWSYTAPNPVSRRGVAYWPGDGTLGPRIFTGSGPRLIALDPKTGQPVTAFGENGSVDLAATIKGDTPGNFSLASPPMVYKNLIITGGNNGEQQPSLGLYGDIRAWDARSGTLVWTFHTVPRAGEPGADTWEGSSWKDRSGTNMWAFFSIDDARGLLFAPIGAPTSDYYGGDRKGKNLYGNSIVALDVNTGTLKWYQQLVHHDLWDYDLPATPTLFDVKRNGRTIPAVGIVTKMSLLFIFNRETGEPIYGMEERPVPASNVPGEAAWPTQPFPLKPAPLGRIAFDPAKDFNTLTPEVEAYCKDLWQKNGFYTKGVYTPAGTDGYMVTFPSTIGGGNWNGLTYDPSLGYVFTNLLDIGQVGKMVQGTDRGGNHTWLRSTPWGGPVGRFWNPADKIPCNAPPFGELVAVNVNTGDIAWHVPLGFIQDLKDAGFPNTGAPNLGGSISTASGLIFVGATNDAHFRAFESRTGKLLWDTELEASAHTMPMTYMGKDGRQYVVVAAGGGGYLGSPTGTKLMAFALPGKASAVAPMPAHQAAAAQAAKAPQAAQAQAPAMPFQMREMTAAESAALPAGEGRDAVAFMCVPCHGVLVAIANRKTALAWTANVEDMRTKGARGTDAQAQAAAKYLAKNFAAVDVNTATSEQLVEIAGFTAQEAAAIVAFRAGGHPIKSYTELKKVPGLDPKRLAQARPRLAYAPK